MCAFLVASVSACAGGGDDGPDGPDGPGPGPGPQQVTRLEADFYGARALLSVARDGAASESEARVTRDGVGSSSLALTVSDQSPLFAMTSDGLKAALRAYTPDNQNAMDGLPRLSYVAVSPIGDVFLAFERSFLYRDVDDDGTPIAEYQDPWSPSSPYTCQLFVADKKVDAFTEADQADPPGFSCVTWELELNTWDFRSSKIQFDDAGNAYFSAHVPQNWKNVLIRWDAASRELSEVINANICYREFLITGDGGILYTGITSTTGDCNGTSFLRYRTPGGQLQEITQGWWDYQFAPIERGEHSGDILFFGPDPAQASVPDWNDACLYRFDTDASGEDRATPLADCNIDIWGYVEFAESTELKRERCLETKSLIGGNQVDSVFLSDSFTAGGGEPSYGSDGEDEVYVVSNVSEKLEGEWRCNVCAEADPMVPEQGHCVDSDGQINAIMVEADCLAPNSWRNGTQNQCYNGISGDLCAVELPGHLRKYHEWCQQPGTNWLESYSALARVDADGVERLSNTDEIVTNAWTLGGRLVYSTFNAPVGEYQLREVQDGDSVALLSGIEVYELIVDPRDSTKWFLNGLRFSDNSYITGTLDPATLDLSVETGITGQIETLVIVPD